MNYMGIGLPTFIRYYSDNQTYLIYPRASSQVGSYKIAIQLNDGRMIETFTFLVRVNSLSNQVVVVPAPIKLKKPA